MVMKTKKILIIFLLILPNSLLCQLDEYYYKLATELSDAENYHAAIYYYDRAIKENPGNSIYFDNRGYAKTMVEDYTGALQDYKIACEMVPDEPLYHYMMGNIYQELDSLQSAIVSYSNAIDLQSDPDYLYYMNRANTYLKLEKYDDALADYNMSLHLNSEISGSYINRGITYYYLGDTSGACRDWEKAYQMGQTQTLSYINKNCSVYLLKEIPQRSETIPPKFNGGNLDKFRKFIAMNVRYPIQAAETNKQGKVLIGFSIDKEGNLMDVEVLMGVNKHLDEEAVRVVSKSGGFWEPAIKDGKPVDVKLSFPLTFIVGKSPDHVVLNQYRSMAISYLNEGNYKQSINHSNEFLRFNPTDIYMLEIRTEAKEKSGDLEGAQKDRHVIDVLRETSDLLKETSISMIQDKPFDSENLLGLEEQMKGPPEITVEIYYDSMWQITGYDESECKRKAQWKKTIDFFEGEFVDYYRDGSIMTTGRYNKGKLNGSLLMFYPNQNLKCRGEFINGELTGIWEYYFEDGKLNYKVDVDNDLFVIKECYNEMGDTMVYQSTGEWGIKIPKWERREFYTFSGKFSNGERTGKWRATDGEKLMLTETYKNGKFKRGIYHHDRRSEYLREAIIKEWIFKPFYLNRTDVIIFAPGTDKEKYPFIK